MAHPHDLQALKDRISLRHIAQQLLGQPAKHSAQRDIYYAPTRQEDTPSLHVLDAYFIDFGDPENKGDVFKFLEIYAGMRFKEALAYLADSVGDVSAPAATRPAPPRQKTPDIPDRQWQQHHAA